MHRVQYLLRDGDKVVTTLDVPNGDIPSKGDEIAVHTLSSDEATRWLVDGVHRELWPGPSNMRLEGGRPLSVVDPEEYHDGQTVVVVLVPVEPTPEEWHSGTLDAAEQKANRLMRQYKRDTPEWLEQVHLGDMLRELRRRRAAAMAGGEPPPYDPSFGDDKLCRCGHTYYRHFDTYEDMAPVGCKYCGWECDGFIYDPNAVEK